MAEATWTPSIGVWLHDGVVKARVWAAGRNTVSVVLDRLGVDKAIALLPEANGFFSGVLTGAHAGDRYRLSIDGESPVPDPASRSQPDGVHGSSEIIDPSRFRWGDAAFVPPAPNELVIYELHVGSFTMRGDFHGVIDKLPYLADLGITAIELMPVAEFAGHRNWGYDGASLYAPTQNYGGPIGLRELVNAAHRAGIAVLLDVVYNHLGPEGMYLPAVSARTLSDKHHTPWGCGLNFDDTDCIGLREFFIENALHWVNEYHVDGFRLDATHAIQDDSTPHFLAEFAQRVRAGARRPVYLAAEDYRNLNFIPRPAARGGYDFDAVWADDFHHQSRRLLNGDSDGHFADYSGTTEDLATTIRQGWFFSGQGRPVSGDAPGTSSEGLAPSAFVHCLQNHDQVGNRPTGDRLHHDIDDAQYRAASALLLMAPGTPLLFMGQEWAVSSPFQFFTAHEAELGALVTAGRKKEFAHFDGFDGEHVPDPQAPATFSRSVLRWHDMATGNSDAPMHVGVRKMYQALVHLRRSEPLLQRNDWEGFDVQPLDEHTIVMSRVIDGDGLITVVRLHEAGTVNLQGFADQLTGASVVFSSEDAAFVPEDAQAIPFDSACGTVTFARAGAVVLRV